MANPVVVGTPLTNGTASASSISVTGSVDATADYLCVHVSWFNLNDTNSAIPTAVTWNGVSMSLIHATNGISERTVYTSYKAGTAVYGMASPATGSHTASVTFPRAVVPSIAVVGLKNIGSLADIVKNAADTGNATATINYDN